MKQHLLLFATGTLLLLANSNTIQANGLPSEEAFVLNNYSAYAPDLPALPQGEDFLCGDVNEDGLVNVLDIISLVNYIMGGDPNPFDSDAADVNADGVINVLDIIALVNIIMQVPGMPCGCVEPVLHEGQTYSTVQIGDQCWMRENLNVGTMINSSTSGPLMTNNGTIEKYCYDNNTTHCNTFGGLYEWNEAIQYVAVEGAQGICPVGWHIPSDGEWKVLEGTVDSEYPVGDLEWEEEGLRGLDAGSNLKETGISHWTEPNTATNSSGFTALPGGIRNADNGYFNWIGFNAFFWSSSEFTSGIAWSRKLLNNVPGVVREGNNEESGYSIRCLKGCWPEPSQANAGPDQLNIQGTSTTLAGNTPEYGTGLWATLSGTGGTVVTPASPTSEFQGVAGNAYSLTWTINTQCGSTVDTVLISFSDGFSCGNTMVDSRDGQTYATVAIGTQCWMAENLNVGVMIESNTGGQLQTDNGIIEKYCCYNLPGNCDVYGALYEWNESMQYIVTEGAQGICPMGWHIPTDNDWKILEGTVDSQYPVGDPEWDGTGWRGYDAGGNLKEAGTDHWNPPNAGATNGSGFTALPGGSRHGYMGYFGGVNTTGGFWTSSQSDANYTRYRCLGHDYSLVNRYIVEKVDGYSVRCVHNCSPQPTQANAGPDQLSLAGTSTTLAGNTPTFGSGVWSIVSGTGGTFVDPWSPAAEFQGIAGNEYTLAWTITTQCGSSADQVMISFAAGFTCGDNLLYEEQSYATVLIGTQCWMAENLNVGTKINSGLGGQVQMDNDILEKYCYNDDEANCYTYGGLYEWNEAMQYVVTENAQGICPAGWHLPTDNEVKVLEGTVDSQYPVGDPVWDDLGWRGSDAGGNLKATGTIENGNGLWYDPNAGATNSSGFMALPGGSRQAGNGQFQGIGASAYFWSSSGNDTEISWNRALSYGLTTAYRDAAWLPEDGLSVRCLKDNP